MACNSILIGRNYVSKQMSHNTPFLEIFYNCHQKNHKSSLWVLHLSGSFVQAVFTENSSHYKTPVEFTARLSALSSFLSGICVFCSIIICVGKKRQSPRCMKLGTRLSKTFHWMNMSACLLYFRGLWFVCFVNNHARV